MKRWVGLGAIADNIFSIGRAMKKQKTSAALTREEGVVFIGKAQEKTPVFRTERRRSPTTGRPYPWIVRRSAMVNNYYIYAVDRDFGPFFLKFCSYFPFNAKLCLNGHEYAKRQLTQQGIAFEALDNGILSCADPTPGSPGSSPAQPCGDRNGNFKQGLWRQSRPGTGAA
jgi:hypothetical protein